MIRRALHRKVESDLHALMVTSFDKFPEIGESSKLGMDRIMAAGFGTDGIGAAGVSLPRFNRVITSFAVLLTDRMDRGEVDDIEAHCRHVRQSCDAIIKCAMSTSYFSLTAWHHFIPRSKPRAIPVHHHRKVFRLSEVKAS